MEHIARNDAFALLKKYNKDPFHMICTQNPGHIFTN